MTVHRTSSDGPRHPPAYASRHCEDLNILCIAKVEARKTHKAILGCARSSCQASLHATGSSREDDSGVRVDMRGGVEAAWAAAATRAAVPLAVLFRRDVAFGQEAQG